MPKLLNTYSPTLHILLIIYISYNILKSKAIEIEAMWEIQLKLQLHSSSLVEAQ